MYNLIAEKINNVEEISKPKIVILPKIVKKFTLLRAPFRHKLTKKNYTLIRYKSIFCFSLLSFNSLKLINISDLFEFIKLILRHIY